MIKSSLLLLMLLFVHDDGRYANSSLKPWFDTLSSKGGGACCSQSDGKVVDDPDWTTIVDPAKPKVHYRVRLEGQWVDVPDDTVITEPNKAGHTMVWPMYLNGNPVVRCFLPGTMI